MEFAMLQSADMVQLIQTVGFPIVAALALGYFAFRSWLYTTKKLDDRDATILNIVAKMEQVADTQSEAQEAMAAAVAQVAEMQKQMLAILEKITEKE